MPRKPAKVVSIDAGDHRQRVLARRDKLIAENFHLVRPIAERVMLRLPPSFELDDLVQTGHLGLLDAAIRYRPGAHNGTPFSAYARKRIHGTIIDSVRRRHYVENTRVGLEILDAERTKPEHAQTLRWGLAGLIREKVEPAPSIEISIDRKRLMKRIAIERQYLNDEQAAVLSSYLSVDMPSLATVAARLAIPERRAYRAYSEALAILRKVLHVGGIAA